MTWYRSQRGSGLVLAMVVVLVLTALSVGLIHISSRELAGSNAARQTQKLTACAEAGRQLLLTQFRALGTAPTSLQALNVTLGDNTKVVAGHVDTGPVQVDQVKLLPPGTFGSSRGQTSDITNMIAGIGNVGAGTPYRVLVHCSDAAASDGTGGRQLEVEFGVQFGL